jgi:hypothetical protein
VIVSTDSVVVCISLKTMSLSAYFYFTIVVTLTQISADKIKWPRNFWSGSYFKFPTQFLFYLHVQHGNRCSGVIMFFKRSNILLGQYDNMSYHRRIPNLTKYFPIVLKEDLSVPPSNFQKNNQKKLK